VFCQTQRKNESARGERGRERKKERWERDGWRGRERMKGGRKGEKIENDGWREGERERVRERERRKEREWVQFLHMVVNFEFRKRF
jgi:hypothetical protein